MRGWFVSKEQKLLLAARKGDVATVRALLQEGNVDVEARDTEGQTALYYASSMGGVEVVDLMLKGGANPDVTGKSGWSPLHWASMRGCAEIVELLLNAKANPTPADQRGDTPLHIACLSQRSTIVQHLLNGGSDVHAKNEDGLEPLHQCLPSDTVECVTEDMLETLQVLVKVGVTWDRMCEETVKPQAYNDAHALQICIELWAQEHADGFALTDIPVNVVQAGMRATRAYVDSLKPAHEVIFRRKICLVGSSCAGKTSLAKSITTKTPQLIHIKDRTIGIDQFPLRIEQRGPKREDINIYEVTFWDFAGQDAYQVAHSLFFSPRSMYLVCVDLEAFTTAFLQASIMSFMEKQETQLMDEFIDRTAMQWIRMVMARQPDAEFVFIATKEDLLEENEATGVLLKNALLAKLKEVNAVDLHPEGSKASANAKSTSKSKQATSVFVSCTSMASVQVAYAFIEELITKSESNFRLPDTFSRVLGDIVAMKVAAKECDITTRINQVFAPMHTLPRKLKLEPDECRRILQVLHDLGDVLWYEDLGVDMFKNTVILDPLLLIDFIRQVISHHNSGQIISHADLKGSPFWNGISDKEQMEAMKQVLQQFHLVYSADQDREMAWDSDLIVPAYWQTKTPAAWLFGGEILQITATNSSEGEAVRVHWEYHFDYGLPASLFDDLVVALACPHVSFDAGPDWILYEEKEIAACRIMVGRDPATLHRTLHVEAVLAEVADPKQADALWDGFKLLVGALMEVLGKNPGLDVSSFAWDGSAKRIGFKRLVHSNALFSSAKWMPPAETWEWIKDHMPVQMTGTRADTRRARPDRKSLGRSFSL